jgi:hypothetical protein
MFIIAVLWRILVPIFSNFADDMLNVYQQLGLPGLPGLPLTTYISWLTTAIQYGILLAAFGLAAYALVAAWLEEPDTYYEGGGEE